MKNKIALLLVLLFVVTFTSCTKLYEWNKPKGPEVEYSVTWPINGEWWVTLNLDDGDGNLGDWYGVGTFKLMTYNTSANSADTVWITDGGDAWDFKGKIPCNVESKTFGHNTDSIQNTSYDIRMIIKNGKILEDAGKSTSGITTDSIYFEVVFGDDPTTTYYIWGVRRTGFTEDEH